MTARKLGNRKSRLARGARAAPARRHAAPAPPPAGPAAGLAPGLQNRIVAHGQADPKQLVVNPSNWRTHAPRQIKALVGLLEEVGWVQSVVVNQRSGHLVDGHLRVEQAAARGERTIPVCYVDLSAEEEAIILASLDPISAMAGIDGVRFRELLDQLDPQNPAVRGFVRQDLLRLVANVAVAGLTDDDAVPELPKKAVSALGDVWVCGEHRLVCGDATDAAAVATALDGAEPHLMVTDPPYGVEYDPSWRRKAGLGKTERTGKVQNDDRADWRAAWKLFAGDVAYVWHAGRYASSVQESLEVCGLEVRAQIIWAKPRLTIGRGNYHWQHEPCLYTVRKGGASHWNPGHEEFREDHEPCWYTVRNGKPGHWTGDRRQTTLWQVPMFSEDSKTHHGTQKPAELMLRPILNNSLPGEAVYEPFSGSGTTLIACEKSGRLCRAVELDPRYVDVAVLRWQSFTGKTPVLAATGRTFAQVEVERRKRSR